MKAIDYSKLTEIQCSICGQTKPVSEFHKYKDSSQPINGWRYYYRCISCNREQCRKYGKENREKRNARLRRWRRENPEKARKIDRRKMLRQLYDITPADYQAMLEEQDGRCYLCRRKTKRKLHVDHNHSTGQVRHLLCIKCNSVVGWIEKYQLLDKVAGYIRPDAPCHADILLELIEQTNACLSDYRCTFDFDTGGTCEVCEGVPGEGEPCYFFPEAGPDGVYMCERCATDNLQDARAGAQTERT